MPWASTGIFNLVAHAPFPPRAILPLPHNLVNPLLKHNRLMFLVDNRRLGHDADEKMLAFRVSKNNGIAFHTMRVSCHFPSGQNGI
mgnify:CR=1 FL=1